MILFELPKPPKPFYKRVISFFWVILFVSATFFFLRFVWVIPDEYRVLSHQDALLISDESIELLDTTNTKPTGFYEKIDNIAERTSTSELFAQTASGLSIDGLSEIRSMSGIDFYTRVGEGVIKNIPLEEITTKTISDFQVDIRQYNKLKIVRFHKWGEVYTTVLKEDNTPYSELGSDYYVVWASIDNHNAYIYTKKKSDNTIHPYLYLSVSDRLSEKDFSFKDIEELYLLGNGATAEVNKWVITHKDYNWEIIANYSHSVDSFFEYNNKSWELSFLTVDWVQKLSGSSESVIVDISDITEFKSGINNIKKCSHSGSCFVGETKDDKQQIFVSLGLSKEITAFFWEAQYIFTVKNGSDITIYSKWAGKDLTNIGSMKMRNVGPIKYTLLKNKNGKKMLIAGM